MSSGSESLQKLIESLERQKQDIIKNLRDIAEQKAKFVQPSQIPLQLIRDEEQLNEELKKIDDEIIEVQKRKPEPDSILKPAVPHSYRHVPFTNREDEMKDILSSTAPAYHLLDAPAGYGKTALLVQLEQRFKERKWHCTYVAAGERGSSADLINALAEKFGIRLDRDDELPAIAQLGGRLRRQWETSLEDEGREGIVLLIDLEKKPSLPILHELLHSHIPNIEAKLRALATFAKRHNRFRVILAGRYLTSHLQSSEVVVPLRILHLSPFSYDVIRNSVREYLPDHDEESIDQLSAHLFFLTGGHPGCIAHILETYKENGIAPDDLLLEPFTSIIWKNVLNKFIDDIRDGIPQGRRDLREVLDRMSVFRFLDYDILKSLNGDLISEDSTEYDLADELTTTYLLNWRGRFLRDDITRRLLAIHLRHDQRDEFRRRCEQARNTCATRLQTPTVQSPEIWTIGYLFQSLQRYACDIQNLNQRAQIRSEFLQRDLTEALRLLVQGRDILPRMWRQEQEALIQAIEEDWEFHFTVNYYLREGKYTNEPYNQLRERIEQFFAQQPGGSNV